MSSYQKLPVLSLIVLILYTTSAKPLSSADSPKIQVLSEFINDNARQMRNNSTGPSDNANKTPYSLEKAWMVARRNLEMSGAWLHHISSLHPDKPNKPFSRISRGRLGRMPLSYGKRSTRVNMDRDNHKIDRYEGSEKLARLTRARLERMPLSFGKRSAFNTDTNSDEFGVAPMLLREERGSLDRMPLTFGKRQEDLVKEQDITDKEELHPYFTRMTKDRLNRMPLTFGKRGAFHNQATYDFLLNLLRSNLNPLHLNEIQALKAKLMNDLQNEDSPLVRSHRSRLGRMPLTFGKRSADQTKMNDLNLYNPFNQKFNARLLNIQRRSRMDRMPLSFGKRSMSNYDLGYTKRQKVSRMPMAYGKRKDTENVESDTFSSDVNDLLEKGPLSSDEFLQGVTDAESALSKYGNDQRVNSNIVSSADSYLR